MTGTESRSQVGKAVMLRTDQQTVKGNWAVEFHDKNIARLIINNQLCAFIIEICTKNGGLTCIFNNKSYKKGLGRHCLVVQAYQALLERFGVLNGTR